MFIYCIDSNLKEQLLQKGYKLITTTKVNDLVSFIFEYKPEIQFDVIDKTKYFTLNTLHF